MLFNFGNVSANNSARTNRTAGVHANAAPVLTHEVTFISIEIGYADEANKPMSDCKGCQGSQSGNILSGLLGGNQNKDCNGKSVAPKALNADVVAPNTHRALVDLYARRMGTSVEAAELKVKAALKKGFDCASTKFDEHEADSVASAIRAVGVAIVELFPSELNVFVSFKNFNVAGLPSSNPDEIVDTEVTLAQKVQLLVGTDVYTTEAEKGYFAVDTLGLALVKLVDIAFTPPKEPAPDAEPASEGGGEATV